MTGCVFLKQIDNLQIFDTISLRQRPDIGKIVAFALTNLLKLSGPAIISTDNFVEFRFKNAFEN